MSGLPVICRTLGAAALLAALVTPPAQAQPTPDGAAAAASVLLQLDAFRRNDYDAAYAFASTEIRRLFDRAAFERMVKTGYPEIADSASARVASTRMSAAGIVHLVVRIRGVNGQHIEAVYEVVRESGTWRINSVVARPDPGEEA